MDSRRNAVAGCEDGRVLDVLSALSDDRLRRAFGADTLARARAYAADHAVDQLVVLDADPLSFEKPKL